MPDTPQFRVVGPSEQRYFDRDAVQPRAQTKDETHDLFVMSAAIACVQECCRRLQELPPLKTVDTVNEMTPPRMAQGLENMVREAYRTGKLIEDAPAKEAEDEEWDRLADEFPY